MKPIRVVSRRRVYQGWSTLYVDDLELEGRPTTYPHEVVSLNCPYGVAVLPFLDEEIVLLLRQYRHPVQRVLLEIVQGGGHDNEAPKDAALRELLEETGYTAELTHLGTMYPLAGFAAHVIEVYEGHAMRKVAEAEQLPEERFEIVTMPYKTLVDQIAAGEHCESTLAFAVLKHELTRR